MAKTKICLVSSSGGHLTQLKQMLPIMDDKEFFLVTEHNSTTVDLKTKYKTYYLLQQERKSFSFFMKFIVNVIKTIYILIKENPQIVISTGAGATLPMCIIGKVLGAKLIFLESFAKINTPTKTGKIVYKIADYFYIQWPELKKVYPEAIYKGKLY